MLNLQLVSELLQSRLALRERILSEVVHVA